MIRLGLIAFFFLGLNSSALAHGGYDSQCLQIRIAMSPHSAFDSQDHSQGQDLWAGFSIYGLGFEGGIVNARTSSLKLGATLRPLSLLSRHILKRSCNFNKFLLIEPTFHLGTLLGLSRAALYSEVGLSLTLPFPIHPVLNARLRWTLERAHTPQPIILFGFGLGFSFL